MKSFNVEGVVLNEKSLTILRDLQESDNIGIELSCQLLDTTIYNIANPDMGMSEHERLSTVSALLDFKRQINELKKEMNHETTE